MAVNITDTTLRDAHQSLLATRMSTEDMLPIAESNAGVILSCNPERSEGEAKNPLPTSPGVRILRSSRQVGTPSE